MNDCDERPDTLSTLVKANRLFEEAHHIWYKAMDAARWQSPVTSESVAAAYAPTGRAIELYAQAQRYMQALIRDATPTPADAPRESKGT
jgi:hypothetical protein